MNSPPRLPNLRTDDPAAWKLATRYADFIGVTLIAVVFCFSWPNDSIVVGVLCMISAPCALVAIVSAPIIASLKSTRHRFAYGMLPLMLATPWVIFAAGFAIGSQMKNYQDTFPPASAFWASFSPVAIKILLGMVGYSAFFAVPIAIARRSSESKSLLPDRVEYPSESWPPISKGNDLKEPPQ